MSSSSRVFVFPGQGSQFVGMGKDLAEAFPDAKQTFEEIDDALSQKLSRLMFEGPDNDLNLTENTQPALMAVSLAVINVLHRQGGINLKETLSFVAGHSLGEYSALTAASGLDIPTCARLLKLRGQAMQAAVPVGYGSMAAILGLDVKDVEDIAKSVSGEGHNGQICEAANDNSNGQVVVSGHKEAVDLAIEKAKEVGAKKAVSLPVSAPFHCRLMAPAAQKMASALADTDIRPPAVPVVSNVTAKAETEPADIRRLLVDQVTNMVRWRESTQWMIENGADEFYEIGAGKVLSGLIRRINRDVQTHTVGTPPEIEDIIKALS